MKIYEKNNIPFQLKNETNLNATFQRLKEEYKLCTEDIDLIQIGCIFSL